MRCLRLKERAAMIAAGTARNTTTMPTTLELVQIDNEVAVMLPEALLARLKLEAADPVFLVETPQGMHLTPYDPDFASKVDAAREIMRRRRDTLRGLPD